MIMHDIPHMKFSRNHFFYSFCGFLQIFWEISCILNDSTYVLSEKIDFEIHFQRKNFRKGMLDISNKSGQNFHENLIGFGAYCGSVMSRLKKFSRLLKHQLSFLTPIGIFTFKKLKKAPHFPEVFLHRVLEFLCTFWQGYKFTTKRWWAES